MAAGAGPRRSKLIRQPCKSIARYLSELKGLQKLCVSFIVDANDFFESLLLHPDDGSWHSLTHLSMTSLLLDRKSQAASIDRLLSAAASAARRMPNLKVLELWYGSRGQACLIRITLHPNATIMVSHSDNWVYSIGPAPVKAWTEVSHLRGGRDVLVEERNLIDSRLILSHGDAIHYLEPVVDIVHSVSLGQIRREAKSFGQRWVWPLFAGMPTAVCPRWLPSW